MLGRAVLARKLVWITFVQVSHFFVFLLLFVMSVSGTMVSGVVSLNQVFLTEELLEAKVDDIPDPSNEPNCESSQRNAHDQNSHDAFFLFFSF